MALIVQDDNGTVEGANAYITVAEFKAYHDARGGSYVGKSDADIEKAIILATDYLDDRFSYVGRRRNLEQDTSWPRNNAWDRDRFYQNGIPSAVKEATAEYALRALSAVLAPDPVADETGAAIQSKSEEVGPIKESVTYVNGASFAMPRYPAADRKLTSTGLVLAAGQVMRG